MDRQTIVGEIVRIAQANDGRPPGEKLFRSETGLRSHEWRGKYWVKWSDAVREAGFEPNKWVEAFSEKLLIEKYIALTRDLGHLPTEAELQFRSNTDETFPSIRPFRRIGKRALLEKTREFCSGVTEYKDVYEMCEAALSLLRVSPKEPKNDKQTEDGFVYLIQSGRFYKIGRSVSVGQRERQLQIQLPEKAKTVHNIRTDDPVGIEAYWHKRFDSKRKNGEWFDLTAQDVSAFRRRKFM